MNKEIIEIVNILIQKLLSEDDIKGNKENIIVNLENEGYTIEDINKAFQFIFDGNKSFEDTEFYVDKELASGPNYNRVLTKTEKMVFDDKMKSLIYKLNNLELLKSFELELLIEHMLHTSVFNELDTAVVWELLNEIVEDSGTITSISKNLDEFRGLDLDEEKVN